MMTAEQWYVHQNNYKRYGLDMKPRAARPEARAESPVIPHGEKARAVLMLLLAGIFCVGAIISTAYAASVKFEVNSISKGNAGLLCEIENLNVEVKNATNIRTIEEKAENQLGMVYPLPEQFVFLSTREKPQGDFGALLMEQAYN